VTADTYCREIEGYLTRKNDGHLIRIVGPAFELVRGWADQGVPLKVAFRGIDRFFERYYAKGPRRRPVRIDACTYDVLDVFDEWRRAVGLAVGRADPTDGEAAPRRRESLVTHITRVLTRLTSLRAGDAPQPVPDEIIERMIRELDQIASSARVARGDARQTLLDRLVALDAELLSAARHQMSESVLAELRQQALADLGPFRERMPIEAWPRAVEAAVDRAVRERGRLPVLGID
jgi:hypothetical protein